MPSMPIVVVQPRRQHRLSLAGADIGSAVGPLSQQGLDEALRLAVGLGAIGPGPAVSDGQGAEGRGDDTGAVAGAVVAEHALDRAPPTREPFDGAPQEASHSLAPLIEQDFRVGQAAAIIDGHVHVLPADAPDTAAPVAGDPMPDPPDAAELLDVHVEQLPGPRPLVAARGAGRGELAERAQPVAWERRAQGGAAEGPRRRDSRARPALVPQRQNAGDDCLGRCPRGAVRPAGAIGQPALALGPVPRQPLADRPVRYAELPRDPCDRLAQLLDSPDD